MRHLTREQVEALATDGGGDRAHLATCAGCRRALADARGRRALLATLRPHTLSDMAFRRVEARLASAVEEQGDGLRPPLAFWGWLAGLVAVVAVSSLMMLRPVVVGPPGAPARPTVLPPVAEGTVASLTVIRASADARVRGGTGSWRDLTPGQRVEPGESVFGSEVVLSAAPDAGWTVLVSGAMGLGGGQSLSVGAGDVRMRVTGPAVHVVASGLHVMAADAVFAVSRAAAEVLVDVAEGSVELVDSGSVSRRVVQAPRRVRWASGSDLDDVRPLPADGAVTVPVVPPPPWSTLDASDLPEGTVVSLDGLAVGSAPLVTLVGAGSHRLGLTAPGEPQTVSTVDLLGDSTFTPRATPRPEEPQVSARAVGAIRRELERHRPAFQACFEKWLKANPAAGGVVELTLTVAPSGDVTAARLSGAKLPRGPAGCLRRTALESRLPPMGTELELAVPIKLKPVD